MGTLQDDTRIRTVGGKFTAEISRDWEIWGPSGGYLSAVALRAAGTVAPDDHRPASYSCQYLSAGSFGPIDIEAEPVRRGRTAWCIDVALIGGGKRFLQAQVWTTSKMDGPRKVDRRMPDVPGPDALRPVEELLPADTRQHPFSKHFDSRHVTFIDWKTFDPRGSVAEHWYRFRDFDAEGDVFLDCARPLLMIDMMPWPAFHRGLEIKPDYIAPSLDVTAWFHEPPGASQWLLCDARSDVALGGLINGRVDVWSQDGRPIASGGSNLLHVARG